MGFFMTSQIFNSSKSNSANLFYIYTQTISILDTSVIIPFLTASSFADLYAGPGYYLRDHAKYYQW